MIRNGRCGTWWKYGSAQWRSKSIHAFFILFYHLCLAIVCENPKLESPSIKGSI